MKNIVLVCGTEHTREFLHNQLNEYLGDSAYIKSFAVDEGIKQEIWGDLYVFSSNAIYGEVVNELNIDKDIPVIIGSRTINYSNIDKLLFIPDGTNVLFVNDVLESTYNCIGDLEKLEINHVQYFPYYPGIKDYKSCDVAVTAGEVDKVPKGVKTVIDIGIRTFSMNTLLEIMTKLDLNDDRADGISIKYIKKIIELSKKLAHKNKEIIEFERQLRNEMRRKRFYAKYDFNHIIGESKAIKNVKAVAKKLAATDLSVLIVGESGTGKELFASSIHNGSSRRSGPFVAVNFSAIPPNLIESELFGYEDGAFTGARKGGKIGIFEQANGGTIFLDEIGDASLSVQARLLRVLQEKEIMKIGGDRIIPVDIRIVAATNKDLNKLIKENKFREDLYYRLKMAYIKIPPLRDRREDIMVIVEEFLNQKNKLIRISEEVEIEFINYEWIGNVRELRNTLEYLIAVCDDKIIEINDLPGDFRESADKKINISVLDEELNVMLKIINYYEESGEIIGRRLLAEELTKKGYNNTEQKVRTKLQKLEDLGMIMKKTGKWGTKTTDKGKKFINKKDK